VVSLDVPSGLDTSEGKATVPTVEASATLAPWLPKYGSPVPENYRYTGDLYLGDIGIPPSLYKEVLDRDVPPELFENSDLIKTQAQ